jgi:chromosome transmission fidelity protein 1
MESLLSKWKELGILSKLHTNRPLYIEPRSSVESDKIWSSYSKNATVNQSNDGKFTGALLFCVMGGKLSEGIYFFKHITAMNLI